jgi:hypothetical protein
MKIHENFDKYFSVNREPIFESNTGKLYKSIDGSLRVFCKGVLVYSSETRVIRNGGKELKSLFDYEFNSNLTLNEERTVSSEWDMNRLIITMLAELDDKSLIDDLLHFAFSEEDSFDEYYETTSIPNYLFTPMGRVSDKWKECFDRNYPKNILINAKQSSFNALETIRSRGFQPLIITHEGFETFFGAAQLFF